MVPVPQEHFARPSEELGVNDGAIVISGTSGSFPNCKTIKELNEVLYNKVNPLLNTKPRWNYDHKELPDCCGKVLDLGLFDGQFFKVNNQLVKYMDPMSRMILENVYRAIYDAGVSPDDLSGQNIGVYIGSTLSESEKFFFLDFDHISPSSLLGTSKAMFANRISYWLNLKGPSMQMDDTCATALTALEQAYKAIRRGDCEAAIVGSCALNLHPHSVIHFGRIIHLCKDGKTKSYDECADGCVQSEAVCALFIQKAEDALRIIAEIVNVKVSFNTFDEGENWTGCNRSPDQLVEFMNQFYKEAKVSPKEVEYIEGFGVGDPKLDKAELEAFEEVFCKERGNSNPLLVGSVTSNIGYTSASSGLCAINKILLGYKKGEIAANLHCSNPRKDVPALKDGRMRIVRENTPFNRTYTAINGLSITGINAHVLLRGCFKPTPNHIKPSIPYLVTLSGRQDSAVQKIIDDLSSRPIHPEELALLHNIHEAKNTGHFSRGYVILDSNENKETVTLSKAMDHYDDMKRPLWFVYSGMGSQWAGMGRELMRIPAFAAAINKCHKVLAPKGLNIVDIICSPDKTTFDNILHSFVGIAAVQIGLTDVLREVGIVPDKIIGHSVGELGCGYADGCITAEEMILAAYSRGLVSLQTKFIKGSMAAVGLGYQKAIKLCPPEIEVACHNGPESCTISGPADVMRDFVAKLTAQGVFAKEVPCSNIAYHSRYIADAGPKLLELLQEVIKNPKRRSDRWLSTSIPQEKWGEEKSQYCSAWYHTNNLLNSVLFEETSRLVPAGAVLVEVAPHGLLQAILKRSLHPDCRHVPLTKRGHPDNAQLLLEAIGKLFMQGYNPKVRGLYPKVQFPVSTSTPLLSHLVEFIHDEKHTLPLYKPISYESTNICNFLVSTHDSENSYFRNHVVRANVQAVCEKEMKIPLDREIFENNGDVFPFACASCRPMMCTTTLQYLFTRERDKMTIRENLYPFSAALVAVWDTFAMSSGFKRKEVSVQFREVHLLAQPVLLDKRHLELKITVHKGTGEFEVANAFSKVATGFISQYVEQLPQYNTTNDNKKTLDSEGVYKLFNERDYSYSGEFRSIYKSNYSFTDAELLWNNNWVTLIDGMLQLNAIQRDHDTVSQPSHIFKIIVDVKSHLDKIQRVGDKVIVPAVRSAVCDNTRCGGVLMEKVRFFDLLPPSSDVLGLKTLVLRDHSGNWKANSEEYVPWKENVAVIRDATLQSGNIGDLNSLSWVETPEVLIPSDLLVTVRFAGLNLYDVNVATGVMSPKRGYLNRNLYGMDYSGTTNTGEHVMGIVRGGAASACVNAVPELMWPVPEHWSLEDAATVPLAYAQAFYCLGIKAQLYPGMTIFVHGGAGALGQAVISIALANQCKVFTTVADDSKKAFLLKLFPELTEDLIGCSRDHSFVDLVRLATNGEGCDIVISCATGSLKTATLNCASYCGITFDMVQAHCEDSYAYGMHYLTKQRAYVMVDFFRVFENVEYAKMIQSMMSEGIARGYVRPLSRVTYAAQEAKRAFRLLAASRHRGRVILRLRDAIIPAQPRFTCLPHLYQLVVCREENLSLQFVDRLIKCGAQKILLHNAQSSSLFSYKKEQWENLGIEVKTTTVDLSKVEKVQELFEDNNLEVEGLYVVCNGDAQDSTIVFNINIASKSFRPPLKRFAVIYTKTSPDESLYLSRAQLNLPTTILSLKNVHEVTNSIPRSSIIDTIEQALYSTQSVFKVDVKKSQKPPLLQEIFKKTGIKIRRNIRKNTTLRELGIDRRYLKALGVILQYSYHVSIPEETIPDLAVQTLMDIDQQIREPEFKETMGSSAFIRHVDKDEFMETKDLVVLPTLDKILRREGEVDLTKQYLWIVPGLEGHYERFRNMCKRVKLPALVLQPGFKHTQESVQETAQRYVKVLQTSTNFKTNEDFYLLGCETGITTALEMAAILEAQGLTGTVYCVGGCPEEISAELKKHLKHLDTEDKLQNEVIGNLIKILSIGGVCDVDGLLENAASWQEKLDNNLRELMKNVKHTTSFVRALINAVYARVQQALLYKPRAYNLKSRVILIRSTFNAPVSTIDALSQEPVAKYDVHVPLSNLAEHPRCASIINETLSKHLLEVYESTNQCENYARQASLFENIYMED